jgi:ABC-type branched-subunit amino acid transport system permease subunit
MGRLLRGLSDSPVALEAHGANTRLTRIYVFCISAFLAAIGGALLAGVTQSINGGVSGPFGYFNSLALVAVLAFCWRQPLISPLLGALVFEVLKLYRPFSGVLFTKYEGVGFGLLAIGVAAAPGVTGALRVGRRAAAREGRSRAVTRTAVLHGEAWT